MTVDAVARGVDDLVATLSAALADLDNLEVTQGADLLATQGEANSPRKTGTLAGTVEAVVTPTGLALTAGGPAAPYAQKVHARTPWLIATVQDNAATITALVADEVAEIVHTIRGA